VDTAGVVNDAAPMLRLATPVEEASIDALMKASIRDLFPAFYD
jgi:hypothetical protein